MHLSLEEMGRAILPALPMLRAFARSLSDNRTYADDLVQETVARALQSTEKFTPGTNLSAWLVTILRNHFYSEGRKRRREVEDVDGTHSINVESADSQEEVLEYKLIVERFISRLPPEQQEALYLVGYSGLSYEDAVKKTGVRIGTIKSRVSRAREGLKKLVSADEETLHSDTPEPSPQKNLAQWLEDVPLSKSTTHVKTRPAQQKPRKIYPVRSIPPQTQHDLEVGGVNFNLLRKILLPDGRVAEIFQAA